jgi:TonB family protein
MQQGPDQYCEILVQYALKTEVPIMTNNFSVHSKLKNRIIMIYKSQSGRNSRWTYLLLAPILCAVMFMSSCVKSSDRSDGDSSSRTEMTKAEFPGGMEAMVKWMQEEVVYPEAAKEEGAEGTVHVEFTVDEKGKIVDSHVVKSVTPQLDQAAMAVVNKMPDWIPSSNGRTAVSTKMVLPIKFELH